MASPSPPWSRRLKIAAGAAAAAALILAAALVSLRLLFPPEKLKTLALEKLRSALGREVRIASAGVGLRGIDLKGLEISEERDFDAGTFLKAGRIRGRLRLKALLRRRLEVAEVTVEDWECRVFRKPDGSLNVSSLGSDGAAAPSRTKASLPKRGSAAAPVAATWSVGRLSLKQGRVAYEDAAGKTAVSLSGIAASLSGARPAGAFPVELALAYAGRSRTNEWKGRLRLRGTLDLGGLDPARMAAELKPLELEHGGLALRAEGTVRDLAAPAVALKLSVPELGPDRLQGLPLPPGIRLPALDVEIKARKTGAAVRLERLALKTPGGEIAARGSVRFSAGKPLELDLEVRTGDLDVAGLAALSPQARSLGLQGRVRAELQARGSAAAPALTGDARIKGLAATVYGQKLSALDGTVRLSPAAIALKASGKLNRGQLKAEAKLENYRDAPLLRIEGSLSELDLSALPEARSAEPGKSAGGGGAGTGASPAAGRTPALKTSGKLSIGRITHPSFNASKAELQWSLTALEVSRLGGTARLRVGEGRFDNLKLLAEKGGLLKAALFPLLILQRVGGLAKIPTLPSFDRVQFKEITGDYAFQDGVMTIRESHMDSDAAYVTASGTADLGRDELNLRLTTKLGTQVGLKLSGPIGFTVRGPLASPTVRPDAASLLRQPVVEDAIEKGKNLLKGIFK